MGQAVAEHVEKEEEEEEKLHHQAVVGESQVIIDNARHGGANEITLDVEILKIYQA